MWVGVRKLEKGSWVVGVALGFWRAGLRVWAGLWTGGRSGLGQWEGNVLLKGLSSPPTPSNAGRSPSSISSRSARCSNSRMMARAARWWKVSLHMSAFCVSSLCRAGGSSSKLTSHCMRWLSHRPLTKALPSTGLGVEVLQGLACSSDSAMGSKSKDVSNSKIEGQWGDSVAGRTREPNLRPNRQPFAENVIPPLGAVTSKKHKGHPTLRTASSYVPAHR